jgi:hypothetical protein
MPAPTIVISDIGKGCGQLTVVPAGADEWPSGDQSPPRTLAPLRSGSAQAPSFADQPPRLVSEKDGAIQALRSDGVVATTATVTYRDGS